MKTKVAGIAVVVLLLALSATSVLAAGSNTPAQRGTAGWLCVVAGPHGWVHCFPPGAFASSASLPVQVFDAEEPASSEGDFLGTEILIRDDLYRGQSCAAGHGGPYDALPSDESGLPADYAACHHYDTH
jgi:hypothetical protein